MQPISSEIAKVTLKYKRWTMILASLCCLALLSIGILFWTNREYMRKLKDMSHKMFDLKVQLENARKTMGDEALAGDAVTYSTSGEAIPGIHLRSTEDFTKFPRKHGQEKFAN
jgi:hypothetical protein